MIRSFADKETERVFNREFSKKYLLKFKTARDENLKF
jgi:hypothetical protein